MKINFTKIASTCLAGILLTFASTGQSQVVTNFTTAGTYTWTAPNGVHTLQIQCWGAGGAGGGASKTTGGAAGGGGGGGAYAISTNITVVPGTTYTVAVGAGGVHTAAATTGTAASGTNSWFGDGISTTNCLAVGGGGGADFVGNGNGAGGTAGAGASCLYNSTNHSGGAGRTGTSGSRGGGGGGGAGTTADGGTSTGNANNPGAGGVSGGGTGGSGFVSTGGSGTSGSAPGGGGGGGQAAGGSWKTGGDGGAGQVTLTYSVAYGYVDVETAPDGTGSVVLAQTLSSGSSLTVYAVAREAGGAYIANVASTWSLTNATGTVAGTDLVPSSDGKSAVFTAHLAGTGQIKAVFGAVTATPSGVITVTSTGTTAAWNVNADGLWNVAGNWTGGVVPGSPGDTAIFGAGSALRTVTLNANKSLGTLSFTNANSFDIAGSSTLTLDKSGSGALVQVAAGSANLIQTPVSLNDNANFLVGSGSTLTVSGSIGATDTTKTLAASGTGTLVLSGNNTYGVSGSTGTTLSGGGTLVVGNNNALGAGDLAVAADSTLQAGAAGLTLPNNVAVPTGVTATVNNGGNTLTLGGVISGSGGLATAGSGTVVLAGNNTYTGNTTLAAGTLSLASASPLAGGGPVVLNGGDLLGNGTFSLNNNINIGPASGAAGTNGLVDVPAGQTLTLSGVIATNGNTGANGLNVNLNTGNTGTLALSGANTFNGPTYVKQGVLQLDNSLALQNSVLDYTNGTLVFGNITAATIAEILGTQNLVLTNLSGAGVTLTLGGDNGSVTYPANLTDTGVTSGSGALVKQGSGTLTLAGTNSLAGDVRGAAGVLLVPTNAVMAAGSVTASGSTTPQIQVNGGSLSAASVTLCTSGGSGPGNLLVASGQAIISGTANVNSAGSESSTSCAITVGTNGTFRANALTMGRGSLTATNQPAAGQAGQGLIVSGGTVVITNNISMGTMAGANSGSSMTVNSGSLTVGGSITFGCNNGGRWSVVDVVGGSLTVTDTVNGITLGTIYADNDILLVRGGTATVGIINLGNTNYTGTTTNSKVLNVTGGTLYVGAGGIVQAAANVTPVITLTGGTLGATADWAITNNITLGNATIQAADAVGTAHNIALTGFVGGNSLTKTGNGTLTLTAGNFYTNTVLNAGTLDINGQFALGGAWYGGFTFNGGTLLYAPGFSGNGDGDISQDSGTPRLQKTVTLNNTATIDVNGNTVSYAYGIGNGSNGALVVQSSLPGGILNLQGTNTYTGNTTVKSGTLELGVASLATNSTVSVSNGAVLNLNFTGTNVVTALVLNGVNKAPGVYRSGNSAPYLTGTGAIQVPFTIATNSPTITVSTIANLAGIEFDLSWPADHKGWHLLAQTNDINVGLTTTNWVEIDGATTNNVYKTVVNPTNKTVFYRLAYPYP